MNKGISGNGKLSWEEVVQAKDWKEKIALEKDITERIERRYMRNICNEYFEDLFNRETK